MYLTAVIDWYSRKALTWRLSNSISNFCVACLEETLRKYGAQEIFNSDQDAQFTSIEFFGVLKAHEISISMDDGHGRALDNILFERLWRSVTHEYLFLKSYRTAVELKHGFLAQYFRLFNRKRRINR